MDRRDFLKFGLASLAMPAWAQEKSSSFQETTPEQLKAVEKGLDWLARRQSGSGAVGASTQVAFTGLAGLSWLANGSTPLHGKYAKNIRNALKFLLRCSSRSTGYINEAGGRAQGGSGMHGHGYGLLFLAEVYGLCGNLPSEDMQDESVQKVIQKAIKCIERSQDPNGGWYYEPTPSGHEGSVTITQVEALRAARNAGLTVGATTIEKGISYIKKSTNSDGTVAYSLGRGGSGTYALTAAGTCVYAMYGQYDAPEAKRCAQATFEFITGKRGRNNNFDSYGDFYAGQACFLMKKHDERFWTEGYPVIRKSILARQDKGSGAWTNDGYGGEFGTACACIVLQIPLRYLPILSD